MALSYCLLLVFLLANVSSARPGGKVSAGCTLEAPHVIKVHKEALGEPLLIHTEIKVLGVRDVPDSGGSYGVDMK